MNKKVIYIFAPFAGHIVWSIFDIWRGPVFGNVWASWCVSVSVIVCFDQCVKQCVCVVEECVWEFPRKRWNRIGPNKQQGRNKGGEVFSGAN